MFYPEDEVLRCPYCSYENRIWGKNFRFFQARKIVEFMKEAFNAA